MSEQRKFSKGRALERTRTLLGQGLLTSDGELHLRQRRLMQPAFHRERIAEYGKVMASFAAQTQAAWHHEQSLDMHEEMMRLTLAVASRTLFGADLEAESQEIAEALDLSLRMFNYAILPLGPLLEYVPLPWIRRLHRARRRLDEIIERIVADRRATGGDRGDLLSMLLAARDAEGDGTGMDDRQLRDEIVTLLMAGHETTANALTWAMYLVSQHPDVAAKLHTEVDALQGGDTISVADVARLTYTRSIIAESMRLYPPAWIIERRALQDFTAGGYRIRRDTLVFVSQYLVHRDPRWWPRPEEFLPDRWLPENQTPRPKFSYFPFGAGTRTCIGEHFAWMEATIVLATIARNWTFQYMGEAPPVPEPLVTLRPRDGLLVRLIRRGAPGPDPAHASI